MFKDTKYTRVYYRIIEAARSRATTGYTERHHIVPRCLGGSNEPDNIIALTAREHFVCHRLETGAVTSSPKYTVLRQGPNRGDALVHHRHSAAKHAAALRVAATGR